MLQLFGSEALCCDVLCCFIRFLTIYCNGLNQGVSLNKSTLKHLYHVEYRVEVYNILSLYPNITLYIRTSDKTDI